MPRDVDPGTIKTGSGKQAPDETTLTLGGAGMAGVGPNIGEVDGAPAIIGEGGAAVTAHASSQRAHPASAIYTVEGPETVYSGDVEGQLDELAGRLPPEPPRVGFKHTHLTFTGVPDWGILKMADSSLRERPGLSGTNDPADIFPYYLEPPAPSTDPEFPTEGEDPRSDPTFNSGIAVGTLAGAGPGDVYAGGYTTDWVSAPPQDVILSHQLLENPGTATIQVTLSGAVYPADRGVLALFHWPAEGNTAAFLAQNLLDRCIAAILLGQGIQGGLGDPPCEGGACDGEPGGIFDIGTDDNGEYDPFVFPGRATGQYGLNEIVAGVSIIDSSALRAPFDDLDGDGTPGAVRNSNSEVPGPGQVRLGTDPAADAGTGYGPVQTYGIPILGAQTPYSPSPGGTYGNTVVSTANFFRYRLPYLQDYSQATGLKYTPSGVPGTETTTKEKARYFTPASPAAPGVVTLSQAGDYDDFPEDYYSWQVARYRQLFLMDNNAGATVEKIGTYILVHFKKERDFEAFARDGILPDDVTNGYEVYSAYFVDGSTGVEEVDRRVNEETSTTVQSPLGPAPNYGYAAEPYHVLRTAVLTDLDDHAVSAGEVTATSSFVSGSSPATEHVVWISGVAYFRPVHPTTGAASFQLTVDATVNNFWAYSYRIDDQPLTGVSQVAPARMSTPNPAFVGLAPFAYTELPGYVLPGTGPAPGFFCPNANYERLQRVEMPFTHCGQNISGAFSLSNGPAATETLDVDGTTWGAISFRGDSVAPSFTQDAKARLYLRRPFGHRDVNTSAQPYSALGGHGAVFEDTGGDDILYHSTSFDTTGLLGDYGNFLTGASPSPVYSGLVTATKDIQERFLDEVYRYYTFTSAINATYGAGADYSLLGPGMGAYSGGAIEVPVRIGTNTNAAWQPSSYVQNDYHLTELGSLPIDFLQVAGLPDRNPPLSDGNTVPFPSAGMLVYPYKDYSTGYRPVVTTDIATAQPDYTSLASTRRYVRCFDASFSGTYAAAGTSTVLIRVDGLQLQDFEYTAPGPGTLGSTEGIAIMVKVPGLTAWMDLGRMDGDGPDKQDASSDGAGCKVLDSITNIIDVPWTTGGSLPGGSFFAQTAAFPGIDEDSVLIPYAPGSTIDNALHLRAIATGPDTMSLSVYNPTGSPIVVGTGFDLRVAALPDNSAPQDPDTFDGVDPDTGMVYCQVKANLSQELFAMTGILGTTAGKVPLLVAVQMNPAAAAFNLEEAYNPGTRTFSGSPGAGVSSADVRGLVGIRLVEPT